MSVTSIGIQSISGQTGTAQQRPANDNAGETTVADDAAATKQAPPPGTGKFVDKTA